MSKKKDNECTYVLPLTESEMIMLAAGDTTPSIIDKARWGLQNHD